MIQALKDRLGMTEAVEEAKETLREAYDNYPKGIEKIRLGRSSGHNEYVNVHLEEPFDWDVMRDVADDMGLDPEIGDDGHWFGFYEIKEFPSTSGKFLVGNVRNDGPHRIRPDPIGSVDKFRVEVLIRYLNKRYGHE